MKKFLRCLTPAAVLLLAAGCTSTPAERIPSHQAAFNSWPADVQNAVSHGQIGMGFLPEMVVVALGQPDSVYTSATATGAPVEIWAYLDHSPSWSIGVGVGSASGGSAVGTSVGVSSQNWGPNEKTRVTFESGRVVAIQHRAK